MLDTIFAKQDNFITRNIAGEILVVPISGQIGDLDCVYNLDEVSSFVWNKLDGATKVSDLAQAVHREYTVTLEESTADVIELLADLEKEGLVSAVG